MDWTSIIAEIGGGLPAVVIVSLGWLYWNERKRSDAAFEARIADQKTHTTEILTSVKTLDAAIRALEERTND